MNDPIESDLRIASGVRRWSDAPSFRARVDPPAIHSILVIKLDHIGDFVLSFDAMLCLRDAFPNARIDLACAPWNRDLALSLDLFDSVNTIAFFDKRADGTHPAFDPDMLTSLRDGQWDLAMDLRVDPDTRVVLRHVNAKYRVGYASADHHSVMTMALPHDMLPEMETNMGMHQTLLMLRLVRSTIDLFRASDDVKRLLLERVAAPCDIDLSAAQGRFLVVCNPSSGRAAKNWPLERFKRLVAWLADDLDCVVVLLGTKDQEAETADIMRACNSSNVISAAGRTSLAQAVDLISKASLYIGNDTGLTHMAARLDIPTVAIFSGIDPTVMWASLGEHVTILKAPVPCSPCHILSLEDCYGQQACLYNISESSVRSAIRRHLFTTRRYGDVAPIADGAVSDRPHEADRPDHDTRPVDLGLVRLRRRARPQHSDPAAMER